MAVDKRAAKRTLDELMMNVSRHRGYLEAYRKSRIAPAVAQSERILRYDYQHVREHCAEHGLDVPPDVPDEGAE